MQYKIVTEFPSDFILKTEGPVLSLYQETHLASPENEQDPIRFKNLLREARASENSELKLPESTWQCLEQLAKDVDFWNYNAHGLAVFASAEDCQIYRLQAAVGNLQFLGESFYLLPLLDYFDAHDHAYVLSFDRNSFALYEGNAFGLQPTEIPERFATKFKELFPIQDSNSNVNSGSYGGRQASYHGHKAKPEEVEKDQEKFFRHIDHTLTEMLAPHDPIILVSLPEHQADFRKIVKNNKVLDEGIEKPMDSLKESELLSRIGEILKSARSAHFEHYANLIERAKREEKLVTGVEAIRTCLKEGRVDTLLISDQLLKEPPQTEVTNVNELTFAVLEQGGHFYVLPAENFENKDLYLAILRY